MGPFYVEARISRSIGGGNEQILVPVECQISVHGRAVEIHLTRVTDFVRIGGKIVFRAGEPMNCLDERNRDEVAQAYRETLAGQDAHEEDDAEVLDELQAHEWEQPENVTEFEWDQRRLADAA